MSDVMKMQLARMGVLFRDSVSGAPETADGTDLSVPTINEITGALMMPGGKRKLASDFPVKVALGIIGQSNEAGNTMWQDSAGVWQRCAAAAPSQGISEPVPGCTAGFGSMFTVAAEMLAKDGIKVSLVNGAVGQSSLFQHWTGWVDMAGRANSTAYRGKRSSLGTGDPGTRGYLIFVNGATWECTTGNKHIAFLNSTTPVTVAGTPYYSDVLGIVAETTLTSAATPPTFPGSPVVGNTVTDGSLVWTCITVGTPVTDGAGVHVMRITEDGFDPYYAHSRLNDMLQAVSCAYYKKYVYIQNGQSDAGCDTNVYKIALREICKYWVQTTRNVIPIVGLSIYYPAQTQASWETLETPISGGGLAANPDYANSGLTTSLTGAGLHLATPGSAVPTFPFYYGQSLYRAFGLNTASMLQPSSPHVTIDGMYQCAAALVPTLSKILRNAAS